MLRCAKLILVFSWFTFYAAIAQQAVITHVRQEVKLYATWRSILSEESFPDYFRQDSLFTANLLDTIRTLTRQNLQATSVVTPPTITFSLTSAANQPSKQSVTQTDGQADWLVSINGSINLSTTSNNAQELMMKNFTYVCEVQVHESTGKTAWNSRVTLPFSTSAQPGSTYGTAEISKQDWGKLIAQAVAAAFSRTAKRLPPRKFFRPVFSNPVHQPFLSTAALYTLRDFSVDVPLQPSQPRSSRLVLSDTANRSLYAVDVAQRFVGKPVDVSYATRVLLMSGLAGNDYEFWATYEGNAPDSTVVVPQERAIRVRCTAQRLIAGDYTLTNRAFEGLVGLQVYSVHQIPPKNTFEIRANGKTQAIIQPGGNVEKDAEKVTVTYLYMPVKTNADQREEILNTWLAYQIAGEFGKAYLLEK